MSFIFRGFGMIRKGGCIVDFNVESGSRIIGLGGLAFSFIKLRGWKVLEVMLFFFL